MARVPSKEWLVRLADAADAYRASFLAVQQHLRQADMGRIPAWCFAVDRMELEELDRLSPALARAELERRRRRVALHALVELIALSGDEPSAPPEPVDAESLSRPSEGTADAELDRFITVVNFAKAGGATYVNGTFEPVSLRGSLPPTAGILSESD